MHVRHHPSEEGLRSRTGDEATSPGSKLEVHRKQATNAPGRGAPWSPTKLGWCLGGPGVAGEISNLGLGCVGSQPLH